MQRREGGIYFFALDLGGQMIFFKALRTLCVFEKRNCLRIETQRSASVIQLTNLIRNPYVCYGWLAYMPAVSAVRNASHKRRHKTPSVRHKSDT